jgi:hypothetical protein
MATATSYRDFYDVLTDLKAKGRPFDPASLRLLAYDQLILAAMGNAGACRCPIEDVINEKQERRALLLGLPQDKLETMKLEDQLYGDLLEDRIQITRSVPAWGDLSAVSRLYFKLTCLELHPHDAFRRINEAINLFKEAGESGIPSQLAFSLRLEFQSALLSKPSDDWVRDAATKASNLLYGFVTGPEVDIVDKLELRDYICTAGCFYPFGSN